MKRNFSIFRRRSFFDALRVTARRCPLPQRNRCARSQLLFQSLYACGKHPHPRFGITRSCRHGLLPFRRNTVGPTNGKQRRFHAVGNEHAGQQRRSGEPYISHPLTVAITAAGDDNVKASNTVTVDVTVTQAANTLTVKAVKATQKAKASKKTVIKAAKAFKVTKNVSGGKVTYKKTSGAKKITVASNGKITVKKGLKAGKTYTVKVKATSKKTTNYKAASKTVTFKVKVTK